MVCDSISSNSCKVGHDLSSLDIKRLHRRTLGEAHWAMDEPHRADGEVHRECADAILWYLESSDHRQTFRNYLKYYHRPISDLRSGFWNVRRFFTSWLLNLSLALKGELFQILRNTLNWSLVEGIWKSQARSKIYQDDHLCQVWWWSEVSRWPKIAPTHLIFSKEWWQDLSSLSHDLCCQSHHLWWFLDAPLALASWLHTLQCSKLDRVIIWDKRTQLHKF